MFLKEFSKRLTVISSIASPISNYFKALALARCYNRMIEFADDRSKTHPEVIRVPQLRYMLLAHFFENADRHIDVRYNRIFSEGAIGTLGSLYAWQDSGHHTKRTPANYRKRLDYWKAIFDDRPAQITKRRLGSNTQDIFDGQPSHSLVYSAYVTDKSGNRVTYESVIQKRNARYSAVDRLVPFWLPLNYGTTIGGRSGYPSVGGLHFVEDAEREIAPTLAKHAEYFSEFMYYVLQTESPVGREDFTLVDSWAKRHINTGDEYIPSFDLARILSYGLPF